MIWGGKSAEEAVAAAILRVPRAGVSGRTAPAVLLIGVGRMGGALLKGWIANRIAPLIAVEPNPSVEIKELAKRNGITLVRDINGIPHAKITACLVALKPQILKEAAPRLRAIADSGALMISIAAGTTTKSLANAWGSKSTDHARHAEYARRDRPWHNCDLRCAEDDA